MRLTREELDRLAVIDPTIATYAQQHPQAPIDFRSAEALRKTLKAGNDAYNAGARPLASSETEFYHTITMRDGYESLLKVYKPIDAAKGPLFVYCFSGGNVSGDVDEPTRTARALVKLVGATVVSVSYRLAPEYKFPTATYDVLDSLKWIVENVSGSLLSCDPSKGFIIGGISAGAALAAIMSRALQQEPLSVPLTGQWLSIPTLLTDDNVPKEYKDVYLSAHDAVIENFLPSVARAYFKEIAGLDDASPLSYAVVSPSPISLQPRTYFQIDGMGQSHVGDATRRREADLDGRKANSDPDPFRDDALIYDDMLAKAGVPTKVDIYPGCPHGHFLGFPGLEITDRANIDAIVGLGWLLHRDVPRSEAAAALNLESG